MTSAESCVPNLEKCEWPSNSVIYCCSGLCHVISPATVGFCIARPNSTKTFSTVTEKGPYGFCISDNELCDYPPSSTFCCSGVCNVITPATIGYCSSRANSLSPDNVDEPFGTTPNPFSDGQNYTQILSIFGLSMTGIVLLIAPFVGYLLYKKIRSRKKQSYLQLGDLGGLTKAEINYFLNGNPQPTQRSSKGAHEVVEDMPYDRRYEIPEKAFKIEETEVLGVGAFGLVNKGRLWNQEVAIKTVKPYVEKSYVKALLNELKLLIYIGEHENIVSLLGAFTTNLKSGTIYLFLEFCPLGNLLNYLRMHREAFSSTDDVNSGIYEKMDQIPLTKKDLLKWSTQIANGLRFLSDKKVVHGDIAARNILMMSIDHVKISDFGLSRRIYEYTNYVKKQQEPLPWRWMSIQAIRDMTFCTESDVWSFGVTLWEIYSLGEVPYPGVVWSQDFIYKLLDGFRLSKPTHADDKIYEIMSQCWDELPSNRPTFHSVYTTLTDLHLGWR